MVCGHLPPLPATCQRSCYKTAWLSAEVPLWEWAVRPTPSSQFNWAQYGKRL